MSEFVRLLRDTLPALIAEGTIMDIPNNGEWRQWSKYVLKELERINLCHDKLEVKLDAAYREIIMLKVKSGVWGAIAGLVSGAIVLLGVLLKK